MDVQCLEFVEESSTVEGIVTSGFAVKSGLSLAKYVISQCRQLYEANAIFEHNHRGYPPTSYKTYCSCCPHAIDSHDS